MDLKQFEDVLQKIQDGFIASQKSGTGLEKIQAVMEAKMAERDRIHRENAMKAPVTRAFPTIDLTKLSLQEARDMHDKIAAEERLFYEAFQIMNPPIRFAETLHALVIYITDKACPKYRTTPVRIDTLTKVQGIQHVLELKQGTDGKDLIASFDLFSELSALMASTRQWTFDEWTRDMQHTLCVDWRKEGRRWDAWRQEEDLLDAVFDQAKEDRKTPDEIDKEVQDDKKKHDECWEMSFQDACEELYDLPFSKDLVKAIAQQCCAHGQHSVSDVALMCLWIQLKQNRLTVASHGDV
jgi:hypothetical protein